MLERIEELHPPVFGLRAKGRVTKKDLIGVLEPLLEEAREAEQGARLLYHFDFAFEGFTPAAALGELRLALRHVRWFQRIAVVGDRARLQDAVVAMAAFLPCPVRAFETSAYRQAVAWLQAPPQAVAVTHRLLSERGVVVAEVTGPLQVDDFDALAATVDSFIASHGCLNGLVIRARQFQGWTNLGAMLRHLRFVRDHHRSIQRVAFAAGGLLAEQAPRIAEHLVAAEVAHFGPDALDDAIAWAAEG